MTVAGRTEGCSLGVGRGEGIRLTVYRLEARMPQGFGAAKILRSLYCVYGTCGFEFTNIYGKS